MKERIKYIIKIIALVAIVVLSNWGALELIKIYVNKI